MSDPCQRSVIETAGELGRIVRRVLGSDLAYRFVCPWFAAVYYLKNSRHCGLKGSGALRVWKERIFPPRRSNLEGCLWLHCSGPGDARAAVCFAESLSRQWPDISIFATYGCGTAQTYLEEHLPRVANFAGAGWHPFDIRWSVRRFLATVPVRAYIGMQGEFWPCLLETLAHTGIPIIALRVDVFNWEVQREFPKWGRPVYERMLGYVDLYSVRMEIHARRLESFGIARERVVLGGDYRPEALIIQESARRRKMRGRNRRAPLLIWAGPRVDELRILLPLLCILVTDARIHMLIAPVDQAAQDWLRTAEAQRMCRLQFYSKSWDLTAEPVVTVLDVFGVLTELYHNADIMLVGDSFPPADASGSNYWEALWAGCLVIGGPETPVSEDTKELREHGDVRTVSMPAEIPRAIHDVISVASTRQGRMERVQALVRSMPRASQRDVVTIMEYLKTAKLTERQRADVPRGALATTAGSDQE